MSAARFIPTTLDFHIRAACEQYILKLKHDYELAQMIYADQKETDLALGIKNDYTALLQIINRAMIQLDGARTAFASMPVTMRPRSEYL